MNNIKAVIFDWGRTIYDKDNERLFPETVEVLEYCASKYSLCIVSLAIDDDIEGRFVKLDKYEIRKYFKFALFHVSDKDSLFRNAVGNLNVPNNQIAVVDDRMKRLAWSIQHGLQTVWVQKGKFADELPSEETGQPKFTIKELAELRKIL